MPPNGAMCCSTLDLSLNEVEMLAARAARGAGLPWGVADQVGRSARWLARQHVAWAPSLAALLQEDPPPARSPFLAGAYLADLAGAAGAMGPVRQPLWAVPPLAAMAARHGGVACVRLGTAEILLGDPISATQDAAALLALPDAMVSLHFPAPPPVLPPWPAPASRVRVQPSALEPLRKLAARTYVPSGELSRRGAGAAREED